MRRSINMFFLSLALAVAASGAPAPAAGPLTSFESESDNPFTAVGGATAIRMTENASQGTASLKVVFPGSDKPTWPGLQLPGGDNPDWSQRKVLLADIFLASEDPASLATRLDTAGKGAAYGAQIKLRPGWNKSTPIEVTVGGDADMTQVKTLLIYASKPQKDIVFYIDNVRWSTTAREFKRIVFVETAPKPKADADDEKRGFIVHAKHYLSLGFENSRPVERITDLSLFAAKGETEPLAVNVYALRKLGALSVSVSQLTDDAGNIIPSTAWTPRVVGYMNKRVNYQSDRYHADAPIYLAPHTSPAVLAADRNARYWLTIQVPQNAKAGKYRGSVSVVADGSRQIIPLSVRILPFELPEPKGMLYGQYYRLHGSPADPKARIHDDLADMRAHGMTTLGLCIGVHESSYSNSGGKFTFAFNGSTPFEYALDAYRDIGFPEPVILLNDSGQHAAGKTAGYKAPGYDDAYVAFHKGLAAAAKEKKWPVIYIQPVDEPAWNPGDAKERNVYHLRLLKTAGIPTEQDGPGDAYFHGESGKLSDIWNYNGVIGKPDEVAKALGEGKIVCVYNFDVEGYLGETDRWACGLFTWRHGLHGAYNWEYRGGNGSIYDDLDSQLGDWVHNYLPTATHPGGPSIGWEATREGVDDRKYIALCESTIVRAKNAGGAAAATAEAASKALADLKKWLDDDPRAERNRNEWTTALSAAEARNYLPPDTETNAYRYVSGDYKFPNSVAYGDYDAIRRMVAGHIIAMLAAMGEADAVGITSSFTPALEKKVKKEKSLGTRPFAKVMKAPGVPVIDGNIEGDDAWRSIRPVSLTLSDGGGKPAMPTKAYIMLGDGMIYIGFVCDEEAITQLTANVRDPKGPVWDDDCVEVFIDPTGAQKELRQVIVNTLSTVWTGSSSGSWNAAVKAKALVDREKKQWTAEIAIPAAGMTLTPRFGINFCRERRPVDSFELSSWSPTGQSFKRPERFGIAVIEGDIPLASFESDADNPFTASGGAELMRANEHASDGTSALKVTISGNSKDTWQGALMTVPADMSDWSARSSIMMDVFLSGDEIPLMFKLEADKGVWLPSVTLKPGMNTNVIADLTKPNIPVDITKVRSFFIYISKPRKDCTLHIDNVRVSVK
ncbi:MAG: hypothetical protein HZC28_20340 [Spirochaetes bacterium]|nr:hypothetical protein [Spirochaetota bacterium]